MSNRTLYGGDYWKRSAQLRAAATANPNTRCMARTPTGEPCGRTLNEHPPTTSGQPPRWSAGHAWHHDPHAPLQPEVLGCNVAERNDRIHHPHRPEPHTETW